MYHGHRGEEFLIWSLKTRRGQDAGPRPSDLDAQSTNAWLDEHPNCNVGVKNGYGEMVYQYWTGNPKPLKQGGPVRTGEPVRVISHGERGPEVTVYGEGTRVTPKGEPHAVRQNDLVAALKRVAESFPLHTETNRVLTLLARELLSPPDAPSTAFSAAPKPLGLGAVVRTDEGVFVRRIQNGNRDRVWWRVPDGEWYTDSEIGKPTEVLAPGVQL